MMLRKIFALVCLITIITFSSLAYGQNYPSPTSNFFVNDFANVLSVETEQQVMSTAITLFEETGAQVVVVTVADLSGRDIEGYANELFQRWGIGDQRENNGVLILIAIEERLSRIEVGYGLEGALNDAKTGRIQDEYMIAHFQKNDYDSGVLGGLSKITEEIYLEYGFDASQISTNIHAPLDYYMPVENDDEITIFHIIAGIFIFALMLLDIIFNRGRMTRLILYTMARSKGSSRGGGYRGGGGRSGGGGSTRGW